MLKYTPEQIWFIKKNIKGCSHAYLHEYFNAYFDLSLTFKQFRGILHNRGLCNGRDCRFRPGLVPHNKGRKGYYSPGSEKGWFRPGHPGYKINAKTIGSERITADGYVEIKYSNNPGTAKHRWKGKHVIIWEEANGPVPKGHVVIFADGNARNFSLDNLLLVSRGELAVMNKKALISAHSELTKTGKIIVDILMKANDLKRKSKKNRRHVKPAQETKQIF